MTLLSRQGFAHPSIVEYSVDRLSFGHWVPPSCAVRRNFSAFVSDDENLTLIESTPVDSTFAGSKVWSNYLKGRINQKAPNERVKFVFIA